MGFGARLPVSRRSLRYRLIVASDTPKSLTISLREKSSSTAFTTRSRKSWEYGFISHLIFSILKQPLPDEDAPSSFMDGIKTPTNRCRHRDSLGRKTQPVKLLATRASFKRQAFEPQH